jgi:hypothetical protein
MTDTFRERERGEEAKYKLDEERHFKVLCRRNKLFGQWAAERLGHADPDGYAKSLVMLLLDSPDADSALARVRADFRAAGLDTYDLEDTFARCYTKADEALRSEWHALSNDHVPIGG